MIQLLEGYLQEWRTKRIILDFLDSEDCRMRTKISERRLRNLFERNNKLRKEKKADQYVAHSNQGYKLTNNTAEILASGLDFKRQAKNLLYKYKLAMEIIGMEYNLDFSDEDLNGDVERENYE